MDSKLNLSKVASKVSIVAICITVDLQIALHTLCVGTFMIYLITKLQPRLGKESEENDFHDRLIIFTLNKNTFIKIASSLKIFFYTYKDQLF
jgi:hypothetical protein